ncbi:MAG: hypothetical protein HY669_01810 [Chloroflexi bacterium]|nr:hypothetical protein [Chloroflexota bacterium]
MYFRIFFAALLLVLSSLLALPGVVAMAGDDEPVPHENPDVAVQRFDGIAILGYCSLLLDGVLARAPDQVASQREKTPFANVPQNAIRPLEDFGEASVSIARLIPEIEAGLDNLNSLAGQFRLEEAEAQRQQTRDRLALAYRELSVIERSAASAGEELGATSPDADSPLRTAYAELGSRIDKLRRLLELFQSILAALPDATIKELLQTLNPTEITLEAEPAISSELLQKMLEALPEATLKELLSAPPEATIQQLLSALPEATLKELLAALPGATVKQLLQALRSTEITQAVEPTVGFVGDWLSFRGSLSSGGTVLSRREVVLLLDGVPYLSSHTGPDGSFAGQLQIPYNYIPTLTLQALYYPQSEDVGVYLASKSSPIDIQVLFYTATLELASRGKSYPGLDSTLYGRFDYGDQPVPAARDIQVYLDGKLVSQGSVGDSFEQRIPLGPDTALGQHQLLVMAPAQQRYAPVAATATLNVVRAMPIVDVRPPRFAIMPLALNLGGHIYSEVGPLEGAVLEVGFGGRQAQAITSGAGVFTARLKTGFSFSLIGSQELSFRVTPREPWNSPASLSFSLVAINPILIGLIALALGFIVVAAARRLKATLLRPASRAVVPGALPVEPAAATDTGADALLLPRGEAKGIRHLVFELYSGLLRLIQGFTGVTLKPQLSLREFVAQCAPFLGPAHKYMEQFTGLIERYLYSRHQPQPADLERSRELNRLVEESAKHDRA